MNTDRGQISGSYDDGSGGCLACRSERGHQVAVVARTCRQLEKMIKMLTLAKKKKKKIERHLLAFLLDVYKTN